MRVVKGCGATSSGSSTAGRTRLAGREGLHFRAVRQMVSDAVVVLKSQPNSRVLQGTRNE
jgi:hypothetical protein